MTEQQPYSVHRRFPDFEVRRYPDHVLVEVDVSGTYAEAGNRGFQPLIRYISGNNAQRQQIAMTAPVIQTPQAPGRQTVSFVMPASMDVASAPEPLDTEVRRHAVTAALVAALTFSGTTTAARFEEGAERLLAAAAREGLETEGEVYFARYDPPWKPGFLRRNDVLIRVRE